MTDAGFPILYLLLTRHLGQRAVIPPAHCSLILGSGSNNSLVTLQSSPHICAFSYPPSTMVQKHMMPFLTNHQKVNNSLTLHHTTSFLHFIPSQRHFTTSCRKKGEYSTITYFERKTHAGNFIKIYCHNYFIIVDNLSLSLNL